MPICLFWGPGVSSMQPRSPASCAASVRYVDHGDASKGRRAELVEYGVRLLTARTRLTLRFCNPPSRASRGPYYTHHM